jgi:hypothetical protein
MSTGAEHTSSPKEPEPQARTAAPAMAPADTFDDSSAGAVFALPPVDPAALTTLYRQPLSRPVNATIRAATFRRTQQTYGNRIVQRVLARSAAALPARLVQRKCACGGTCEDCQQAGDIPVEEAPVAQLATESEAGRVIQRQADGAAPESGGAHEAASRMMAASQAQPLDQSALSAMEAGFGRDLSGVRVHTDAPAADAAAILDAAAFTTGRDIYFSESRFSPSSDEGRHLLTHEIAHTIQQSDGLAVAGATQSAPFVVAPADDPLEAEADRAAEELSADDSSAARCATGAKAGQPTAATDRSPNATGVVQRTPEEEAGVLPARPGAAAGTEAESSPPPEPAERMRPRSEFFYAGSYRTGYYPIANDREFMRTVMMRLIADKGLASALYWVVSHAARQGRSLQDAPRPISAHTFADRPRVRSPLDVQREMAADEVRQRVAPGAIPLMLEVFSEVYREAVEYLDGFEERARSITLTILQSSEDRVNAERVRYGLERTEVVPADWSSDDFGQPNQPEPIYSHSMSARGPSEGLVGAAKDLKAKRDAIDTLQAQRARLYRLDIGFFTTELYLPEEHRAQNEELMRRIDQARTEYNVLRSAYERRYPILARFAENPQALGQIAHGAGAAAAATLNKEIYGTLENIRKVRRELTPGGRVKIWKLPEIVHLTKVATQASGDSMRARMRSKIVDDKREQILDQAFWRNLAIGALALGLALLAAIPTGGSSLLAGAAAIAALGSLGLSVYLASESLQDYNLEKAMTGTDFDRAQAISNEDPSLFWLAVDIVGVVLDVGPALKATRTAMTTARTTFRTLAPLARRAITAQGPEAAEALKALRTAARNEQLGEAVVRSVERLRAGTDVEQAIGRAAGHEAAARAASLGTDSVGRPATTVIGGHTVRVAPGSGALVICSSCIWVRGLFATELADNAGLLRRLETLEENARVAAAADDAAAATRVAEQTRQLADELLALRRTRLRTATRVLSATEIEEFGRLRTLDPARMTQEEIESLQRLREASGEAFQGRLAANTPDHKAERWLEYRSRGGEWTYARWSANYQQNMPRAARSHALVDAHRAQLGWGETQVVTQPFGPDGARRILDIAEETVDPLTGTRRVLRAVEHKEGYITMSDAIRAEIQADRALVQQGTAIEWYIDGRASQGLRDALAGPPPIPLRETRPTVPVAEIRGGSSAAE